MEKNITITGDQARMLLSLMTHDNVTYRGGQLLNAALLLQQFLEISNVQPPIVSSQPSNDSVPG